MPAGSENTPAWVEPVFTSATSPKLRKSPSALSPFSLASDTMSSLVLPDGSASSTNSWVISPASRLVRVMIDSPALTLAGMPLYLNFCTDSLYTGSAAELAACPCASSLLHPASANANAITAAHTTPSQPLRGRHPPFPDCRRITTSSGRPPTSWQGYRRWRGRHREGHDTTVICAGRGRRVPTGTPPTPVTTLSPAHDLAGSSAEAPRPGGRGASGELPLHRERLGHVRAGAVAGVDVDLARLHHELAAVVVEAEVALVERERDRGCLAGVQRHALEPAQAADGLRDAGHRVMEVELHDLVTLAAAGVRHGHGGLEAAVLRHGRGAQPQVGDLEGRVAEPVTEHEQRRAARDVTVARVPLHVGVAGPARRLVVVVDRHLAAPARVRHRELAARVDLAEHHVGDRG